MTLGISGVGQSPFPFLAQSAGQQSNGPASSTGPTQALQSLQGHHRHRHHGGGSGVQDLLNAVSSALNSADPSADPNQVIQDTITKLLAGDSDGDGDGSNTSGNTTTVAGSNSSTTGQSTTAQSFVDTLKAHGVDLQQFRADLLAAVKNAQNGQVNPATALQSFPLGSTLNATA